MSFQTETGRSTASEQLLAVQHASMVKNSVTILDNFSFKVHVGEPTAILGAPITVRREHGYCQAAGGECEPSVGLLP